MWYACILHGDVEHHPHNMTPPPRAFAGPSLHDRVYVPSSIALRSPARVVVQGVARRCRNCPRRCRMWSFSQLSLQVEYNKFPLLRRHI